MRNPPPFGLAIATLEHFAWGVRITITAAFNCLKCSINWAVFGREYILGRARIMSALGFLPTVTGDTLTRGSPTRTRRNITRKFSNTSSLNCPTLPRRHTILLCRAHRLSQCPVLHTSCPLLADFHEHVRRSLQKVLFYRPLVRLVRRQQIFGHTKSVHSDPNRLLST